MKFDGYWVDGEAGPGRVYFSESAEGDRWLDARRPQFYPKNGLTGHGSHAIVVAPGVLRVGPSSQNPRRFDGPFGKDLGPAKFERKD